MSYAIVPCTYPKIYHCNISEDPNEEREDREMLSLVEEMADGGVDEDAADSFDLKESNKESESVAKRTFHYTLVFCKLLLQSRILFKVVIRGILTTHHQKSVLKFRVIDTIYKYANKKHN